MAQAMSTKEFNANKGRINQEYKAERKACNSKAGNAKAICVTHAKGQETVALAEIQNTYLPTLENQYKVNIAKGEAAYKVAKYKCDDLSGNPIGDACEPSGMRRTWSLRGFVEWLTWVTLVEKYLNTQQICRIG